MEVPGRTSKVELICNMGQTFKPSCKQLMMMMMICLIQVFRCRCKHCRPRCFDGAGSKSTECHTFQTSESPGCKLIGYNSK